MLFNKSCRPKCCGFNPCCNPCEKPCKVCCNPVIEPTVTECVEKESFFEIPHIVPIHTHVINKQFVKHSYTPQYTCSEETQVIDMGCGNN